MPLWDALFDKGAIHGIRPMGTNALEIARIEAGFMQAHVDFMPADQAIHLDRSRSPFELDLGRLVDFKKPNFNGRRALLEEQKRGSRYRFVRLEIAGNKVARAAYIYNRKRKGEVVGTVTSAEWSPSAKTNIALASLHMPWGRPGDELWADIYYQRELQWSRVTVPCRVVEGAFFDPPRHGRDGYVRSRKASNGPTFNRRRVDREPPPESRRGFIVSGVHSGLAIAGIDPKPRCRHLPHAC